MATWRVDGLPAHGLRTAEHAHEFPVLFYLDRGRGVLGVGGRRWALDDGSLFVVAPGDVVGPFDTSDVVEATGRSVSFTADALGRLSLKDVAHAVSVSSGHLTTTVRRRTGRTVQEWITDRRMLQARRLLARPLRSPNPRRSGRCRKTRYEADLRPAVDRLQRATRQMATFALTANPILSTIRRTLFTRLPERLVIRLRSAPPPGTNEAAVQRAETRSGTWETRGVSGCC